jgi:hypothetical protein
MRVNKGTGRTRALILLSLEHFRGGITGRSAEGLHKGAPLEFTSEAKVTELDATTLVEENILQLEVTMNDAFVVEICDGETELTEQQPGLVFAESPFLDQIIEQLSTTA